MRNRIEILKDLICLKGNITDLKNELAQFPWDVEEPLIQITKIDFKSVLTRSLSNEISFDILEDWADLIECRDDLSFENDELQEIIFELANPIINGFITKERIAQIISDLSG
jgi:hypothetical protein